MSKDRKLMKKGTVSDDSKPAVKSCVAKTIGHVQEKAGDIVSNDSKPAEKSAVSDDSNPTEETTVPRTSNRLKRAPLARRRFFDFTKLMSQFRLPGVDFAALVDRERKNIEALAKANRIAFEGWQRLVRRQAEMLQETMKKVVADASQRRRQKEAARISPKRVRKGAG